jgi:cytochrome P450
LVDQYCAEAYHEYLDHYDPKARDDLVARLINERTTLLEKNAEIPFAVSEDGIVEEVTNLLFAGTDTTSNTLAYLFWELSHHPEWQLRMREELNDAVGAVTNPSFASISELPVMNAVVHELWRLWPAAPGSLMRVTPENGMTIDGVFVPGNVSLLRSL